MEVIEGRQFPEVAVSRGRQFLFVWNDAIDREPEEIKQRGKMPAFMQSDDW